MANVVVFFAQGFEEIEGLATVDILRRAGHTVHTVGLGSEVITGSHHIPVKWMMYSIHSTGRISMRSYYQVVFQEPLIYEMMNFLLRN